MSIDITFDMVKWVLSGVFLACSTVFVWVAKKAFAHIKNQELQNTKSDLFRADITDRIKKVISKQDEVSEQIKQVQAFMEAQFEVNPVALFICDADGRCVNVNDSLLSIFRAQSSDMLGLGWLSFLHPSDRGRVESLWLQAVTSGNNNIRDHYRVISREQYEQFGKVEVVATVSYKTIFKYDSDKRLQVAVGTVWEIDKQETNDRILTCIAETLESMKGTPLWMEMQQQIKNKTA